MRPANSALLLLPLLLLAGCQSGFQRYYVPQTLEQRHPPVSNAQVIEVGTQELEAVQQQLYADAEVVGSSRFVGGGQSKDDLQRFAGSVGADVALWRQLWLDSTVTTEYRTIPFDERTTVTTRTSDGKTVKTHVTTRRHDYVPYSNTNNTYLHEVLYLRTRG